MKKDIIEKWMNRFALKNYESKKRKNYIRTGNKHQNKPTYIIEPYIDWLE